MVPIKISFLSSSPFDFFFFFLARTTGKSSTSSTGAGFLTPEAGLAADGTGNGPAGFFNPLPPTVGLEMFAPLPDFRVGGLAAPPPVNIGTSTACLHCGHRTRLPANSSPATISRPQSQNTSMGMSHPCQIWIEPSGLSGNYLKNTAKRIAISSITLGHYSILKIQSACSAKISLKIKKQAYQPMGSNKYRC
jgi:hypothetical protein